MSSALSLSLSLSLSSTMGGKTLLLPATFSGRMPGLTRGELSAQELSSLLPVPLGVRKMGKNLNIYVLGILMGFWHEEVLRVSVELGKHKSSITCC